MSVCAASHCSLQVQKIAELENDKEAVLKSLADGLGRLEQSDRALKDSQQECAELRERLMLLLGQRAELEVL